MRTSYRMCRPWYFMACITTLATAPLFAQELLSDRSLAPLAFMENKGQFMDNDGYSVPDVRYLLRADGFNVILRDHGFSYEMRGRQRDSQPETNSGTSTAELSISRIDVDFEGCSTPPTIRSDDELDYYENYYTAQRISPTEIVSKAITHVPAFQRITYQNIRPGISIEFVVSEGGSRSFKYNIIAAPGADLSQLRLRYLGAHPRLTESGLMMETETGHLGEVIPMSWIERDGNREEVVGAYCLVNDDVVGFKYNESSRVPNDARLVIDPTPTWYWGRYIGGLTNDDGYGVRTTNSLPSFVYVCGLAVNSGPSNNAFIAKFDLAGTPIWTTYYGGTGNDYASAIDLDFQDQIYITGITTSTSGISLGVGIHQPNFGGVQDAFLAKFTPSGLLTWGTYFGGTAQEIGYDVALLGSDVIISGSTVSSNGISGGAGVHQVNLAGLRDNYIARFSGANGSRMWGSYYGGLNNESLGIVAVGPDGNAYIGGSTESTTQIASPLAHQPSLVGGQDAFLAKMNGTTGARMWGTYYGGNGIEFIKAIAVNCASQVFAVGFSNSTSGISTPGTHQPVLSGVQDAFLVSFSSGGIRNWATYYGGTGNDAAHAVTVGGNGRVYIGGNSNTSVPDGHAIATVNSPQPNYGGGTLDGFVAGFTAAGVRTWGTYYGGEGSEVVQCVYAGWGGVYSTGYTFSSVNISTLNTWPGGTAQDAFLSGYSADLTTTCAGPGEGMTLDYSKYDEPVVIPEARKSVQAWPNPAKTQVTLMGATWNGLRSIEILDVQGRPCGVLQDEHIQLGGSGENVQVNLYDLSPGLYMLRLRYFDEREVSARLLIER